MLVVGHDPSFTQVVHDFTGGRIDFKKGGVAAVRAERASGELLVLLRPRELESLAAQLAARRQLADLAHGEQEQDARELEHEGDPECLADADVRQRSGPRGSCPTGTAASEPNQS